MAVQELGGSFQAAYAYTIKIPLIDSDSQWADSAGVSPKI
jgi:hypothetical protein